jgi:hypothetical protein
VNIKSVVGEPTNLTMLGIVTRLRTSSTTRELIKFLSKVLDGTHVACGSRIGRGPHVVFRVSFSTTIMSLVLSFKSWKINNGVLTNFCATSHIWSWHSISWLVENCVFSLCTCTLGTREFDALAAYGDYSNSSSPINKTWSICESISLNYLPSGRNSRCHTSLLCHEIGRAKRSSKFWCEIRIVFTENNILPNHGIMWEAIEWPKRSLSWSWTLYRLGMTN